MLRQKYIISLRYKCKFSLDMIMTFLKCLNYKAYPCRPFINLVTYAIYVFMCVDIDLMDRFVIIICIICFINT